MSFAQMRWRILAAILVIVLIGGGMFGWTFVRRPLPIQLVDGLPLPARVEGVSVAVLPTARVETQHGLSVRGASLVDPLVSAMSAFVVTHPRGRVLIDAGMARGGVEHVSTTPLLMQAIIELELSQGVADGLVEGGVQPSDLLGVILTHGHWDHVSGLADLPDVPVWITREELDHSASDPGGLLYRQIDAAQPIDSRVISFRDGPYGPFLSSFDFFGDGSVIVVPLPGHTPGSVGVLVNATEGTRYLFIGDTAWAREGVDWPAEKPWISRNLVDHDPAVVRAQLGFLHGLSTATPELLVVPAHDERVHLQVPRFWAGGG